MSTTGRDNLDYRVAIFPPVKDMEALGGLFQMVVGAHPIDARIWARQTPGVLRERFALEDAQELVESMARLGQKSSVVRADAVPDLDKAVRVHHVRCVDQGLAILNLHGQTETTVPWPAIEMICVGEVPLDNTRHFASERWDGLSGGRRAPHPPVETALSAGLEAWITCSSPYPNLRIDHEHMNYETLGEQRVESATVNFRSLIGELVKRAPGSTLTDSTVSYLQHVDPEHYRFKSVSDLLHYATVQALLARKLADGPSETDSVAASSGGAPPCH